MALQPCIYTTPGMLFPSHTSCFPSLMCWFLSASRVFSSFLLASICFFFFFQDYIYLFLEGEKERERNIVWVPLACPHWGPGPQPRHVLWLGIQLVTLWFTGGHSIHWATPSRAVCAFWTWLLILLSLDLMLPPQNGLFWPLISFFNHCT